MSRCFPYPPPGYTLSRASNEALIESIKLQKEREKARKQKKKEKRREKKEKKKEKKDEPNQKLFKSDTTKSQTSEKTWPDTKTRLLLKGNVAQIEHLEASSLTEEHGPPVRLDVPSTSSEDSTNTSNKRKRDSSPLNESHGHGKIISIKLSSKQNGSNVSANVNEMRGLKSGSSFAAQKEDSNNNLRHVKENYHSALKIGGEQICSTSSPVEGVTKDKNAILFVPNAVVTSMQREKMNYNKLVGNWSTTQLQDMSLDADIDWLFQFRNPAEKRLKIQNDGVSCPSSSALRPHAQLLNEVNIYALPFTVPF